MKTQKGSRALQTASIAGFAVMSASLIFMYRSPLSPNDGVPYFITGIMFWTGFIVGVGAQLLLIKKLSKTLKSKRVGLLCFFKNKYGAAADLALALSAAGVVITFFAGAEMGIFEMSIWALLMFSFTMHCVLNGRKFNYIYHINRQQTKRSVRNEGNFQG